MTAPSFPYWLAFLYHHIHAVEGISSSDHVDVSRFSSKKYSGTVTSTVVKILLESRLQLVFICISSECTIAGYVQSNGYVQNFYYSTLVFPRFSVKYIQCHLKFNKKLETNL